MDKLRSVLSWPFFGVLATIFFCLLSASLTWGTKISKLMEWNNFSSFINNIILLVTLIFLIKYTYETQLIRYVSSQNLSNSIRPVLGFIVGSSGHTAKNDGVGPALNTVLLEWNSNTLRMCQENTIPSVIPPGGRYQFDKIDNIDTKKAKEALPRFSGLIDRLTSKQYGAVCVIYKDLDGVYYCSIVNGTGGNYSEVFEHCKI